MNFTGKTVLPGQTGSAKAAYAKIYFTYSARASDKWSKTYASGGLLVQSRRLDSITSCANSGCDAPNQARYYKLNYDVSPSGNGLEVLKSVEECRDQNKSACLPATTFAWSTGKYEFATREIPADLDTGGVQNFEDFKLGDVDGDGRLDIAYLKDTQAGGGCGTEYLFVFFSTLDGSGVPTFPRSTGICTPAELFYDNGPGAGSWQLFDYNGDGRDDLFTQGANGAWVIYPSLGRNGGGVAFNTGSNLLQSISPAIPNIGGKDDQPQIADLNGDGLIDVVYPRDGTLRARIMERSGNGFAWGAERTIAIDSSGIALPSICSNVLTDCTLTVAGAPTPKTGFKQLADFNGDASSDLLIGVNIVARTENPGSSCFSATATGDSLEDQTATDGEAWVVPPYVTAEGVRSLASATAAGCWTTQTFAYVDAMTVKSISSTSVGFALYGVAADEPSSIVFGDANGDGLTDVFSKHKTNWNWSYRINTGTGFQAPVTLSLGSLYLDQVRFSDVNGDGRTDVLNIVDPGPYKFYRVRYGLPSGAYSGETPLPSGDNAHLCEGTACLETFYVPIFADIDGDGSVDFMSIKIEDSAGVYISRANAASRFVPRDVVTQITNGLGLATKVSYEPMTNKDVYRRSAMLYSPNYGRGSPVIDYLAPKYLVASTSQSQPNSSDPNAMASAYYRYTSARVQGGGRGQLGFRQIDVFDPNHTGGYIATSTTYAQNFPFIGRPIAEVKQVVSSAYQAPVCVSGQMTEACFTTPGQAFPAITGSMLSNVAQDWETDTDFAGAGAVSFAAGTQAPVHVRLSGSESISRDPFTGNQTGKLATTFDYGAYGNPVTTRVDTYEGSSTTAFASTITNNSYLNETTKWFIGRITQAKVTHKRAPSADDVKTTNFVYDPNTGLLKEERLQQGGSIDQDVRKVYTLDEYGNRTSATTCLPSAPSCDSASLEFHQQSLYGVHRLSRIAYDSDGRYQVENLEPFWSPSTATGTSLRQTSRIDSRDIFGNVTSSTSMYGVKAQAQYSALGRPYATWSQTVAGNTTIGVTSSTTYRLCTQVPCPTGAKYRQQVLVTAAPGQWIYFDVLGREVMKAVETFNAGSPNKDLAVTCTAYDVAGKVKAVSNPFLVSGVGGGGPSVGASMCGLATAGRDWTTTTYDVLDRVRVVTAPDQTTQSASYADNTVGTRDARNNLTNTVRNAKGEVTSVVDAKGLKTSYSYYPDGTLYTVQRDAGRGPVTNTFFYDALGRKTQQSDPDSGITKFKYNALGEQVEQTDPYGNRIESWYDARGRVWLKRVFRKYPDGHEEIETRSDFVYDTATNGLGKIASESISGSYTSWTTQPSLAVNFSRTYTYDALTRLLATNTTIDGASYREEVSYDEVGRPWKMLDASGRWSKTLYTTRGYQQTVCNSSAADSEKLCPTDGNTYLTIYETDAWGNVIKERRGSSASMDVSRSYWSDTGRIAEICAGTATCSLMKEGYGWDAAGNLSTQAKESRYTETFVYDSLNRLTTGTLTMRDNGQESTRSQYFEYDAFGNLCRRENLGWSARDYTYAGRAGCGLGDAKNSAFGGGSTDGTKSPHQVIDLVSGGDHLIQAYDARGNGGTKDSANDASDSTIRYTLEDQAYEMTTGAGSSTRFWYGSDGARYKRVDGGKTTLYLGNVEIEIVGAAKTYKRNMAGVMLQTSTSPTGTAANYYLFQDQLGSVVRITNASGAVVNNMDFLAFGGRRDFNTQAANGAPPTLTTRGFTGHETVDGMNVIHMNGRVYDSYVGRFLQVDPIVQEPENAQNWNAYSYVINNPYKYTDPTGNFFLAAIAASITTLSTVSVTASALTALQIAGIALASGATISTAAISTSSGNGVSGAFDGSVGSGGESGSGNSTQPSSSSGLSAADWELPADGVRWIGERTMTADGGWIQQYLNVYGEKSIVAHLVLKPVTIPETASALNTAHNVLDAAGFLPFIGTAADVVNAGVYAFQGEYAMAGLAMVGAIPIIGDGISAAVKLGKAAKVAERAADATKFWSKAEFKGTRVYQRSDLIDPMRMDARGRTSLDLMRKGNAPIGPDGKPLNLHHMLQSNDGPLAEMTQTFHQVNSKVIHINPSSMPSGIDRKAFDAFRKQYWQNRAGDF